MEKYRIAYLCQRYLDNACSADELLELEDVMANPNEDFRLKEVLHEAYFQLPKADAAPNVQSKERIYDHIIAQPQKVKTFKMWPGIAVAAALLLVIGAGLFYYYQVNSGAVQTAVNYKNDVKSGGNKAYLTLSNGKRIELSGSANGKVATESGLSLSQTNDGQLIYELKSAEHAAANELNTLETPRGGQYQVLLPDGTKVWLNAASSITYQVNFRAGKERNIKLSGEAYFEVAKDKERPFFVETKGQVLQVLGTHFNVNGYADEGIITTTLTEGRIALRRINSNGGEEVLLNPGQQALFTNKDISLQTADTKAALAWKNGNFIFRNEKLSTIMYKVSRWYDVEIVFEGPASLRDKRFEGEISRFKNVSEVLRKFELTNNVHFKIEGRRITVMP